METVVTPLEIRIGGNEKIKVEVGLEARVAIRRDALRSLSEALEAIKDAEEQMPGMDDPAVRASIEYLSSGLAQATRATDALWYLAPEYDDGEPLDE